MTCPRCSHPMCPDCGEGIHPGDEHYWRECSFPVCEYPLCDILASERVSDRDLCSRHADALRIFLIGETPPMFKLCNECGEPALFLQSREGEGWHCQNTFCRVLLIKEAA